MPSLISFTNGFLLTDVEESPADLAAEADAVQDKGKAFIVVTHSTIGTMYVSVDGIRWIEPG